MTRALSIALLLLIGLPLISPLFALGSDAESNLPACCRRNGAHHCAMSEAQIDAMLQGERFGVLSSKCPMYPKASIATHHQQYSFERSPVCFTEALCPPEKVLQAEAWARVALAGARHKRGPPAVLLS